MKASISILIVTWNSRSFIDLCLQSLVRSVGRPLEIIVIDNDSSDETPEIVSRYPSVELVVTSTNLGFAPAMNIALRRARGHFLCMLNPDTIVSTGALDHLADFLDQNESASAAGPKLLDDNGQILPTSARPFPSLWGSVARQFGLAKAFAHLSRSGQRAGAGFQTNSPRVVQAVSGAVLMFRKTVFEQVGPLDETIPMYFEDLDYCARLGRNGPVYCVPAAVVHHSGAKSADEAPVRRLLYAMEDGEAPWLYFRHHRNYLSACLFVAVTLLGSIFRLSLFFPLLPLRLVGLPLPSKCRRLISRAEALLWWSLSPRKSVEAKIKSFFGHGDHSAAGHSLSLFRPTRDGAS